MAIGTPLRAETIPQLSANKIIQLAPINSAETLPVVSSVALDPAGKLLAAVGDDHLVRVFDLSSGKLLHRWASHVDWVKASAFRPNGSVLATSGADRRICFWDIVAEGKTRSVSDPLPAWSIRWPTVPTGECWRRPASPTRCGCSTPSRESCSANCRRRAATSARSASRPTARGWPPRGERAWSASGTRASGQQISDVQVSTRRICALAYSPDGKFLAAAGQQRIVRLLDAASGKPVADLPERPGEVMALCFCGPDALASAGSGNVIHLWDMASRQERCRLVGHTGSITTLVFNRSEADADFRQLRHHGSPVGREAPERGEGNADGGNDAELVADAGSDVRHAG